MLIFAVSIVPKVAVSNIVISALTEPNFTKFLHNAENLLPFNLLKSELLHHNLFRNVNATNENKTSNFDDFASKIGCHRNVP